MSPLKKPLLSAIIYYFWSRDQNIEKTRVSMKPANAEHGILDHSFSMDYAETDNKISFKVLK